MSDSKPSSGIRPSDAVTLAAGLEKDYSNMTALVFDDQSDLTEIGALYLGEMGFRPEQITRIHTAQEFDAIMKTPVPGKSGTPSTARKFDLLITDYAAPDEGLGVILPIQYRERFSAVVIFTGHDSKGDLATIKWAAEQTYLNAVVQTKPANGQNIMTSVAEAFAKAAKTADRSV